MTKRRILLSIPVLIIAGQLTYCWTILLTTDHVVRWQHLLALMLFLVLLILFFKKFDKAVIATGIYLIIGTFTGFSLTPVIHMDSFGVGPIKTPSINLLSFGILIIYSVLNFDTLINIYLDYKEAKTKN